MIQIFTCCKFANVSSDLQRLPITSLESTSSVEELRQKVIESYGLEEDEFDLIFCGKYMRDAAQLSTYQISEGSTVHVLKRVHRDLPTTEPLDESSITQVVRAMRQIIKTPASRNALERVISNPDTLNNLIRSTPSLASDPVAMAIFQDKQMLLLSTVADKETINRMLTAHPSLGHAALHLASAVNTEVVRAASSENPSVNQRAPADPRVHYGLDLMSDEDDDDDDDEVAAPGAAVGTAEGQGRQITADFFRQAMQMVFSGAAQQQPAAAGLSSVQQQPMQQPQAYQVTEAQLQQLRDMGIADETLARRALEVTGGDIQLALEFIFGDDSMS